MGLLMGIGKRELLEDYYIDEVPLVIDRYCKLRGGESGTAEEAAADEIWG